MDLDLDLDHIVATSLRILTATVLDSDEMLGPLEEKLCPQKLSVEFLPYGFASAQKMFFFTEWPCHAHESNWSQLLETAFISLQLDVALVNSDNRD